MLNEGEEMVKQMKIPNNAPISLLAGKIATDHKCYLIMYRSKVAAGFPSPADDYIDKQIDLTELLIRTPAASYIATANGDSMLGVGIFDGDLLIVDRSIKACSGHIIIAAIDGLLTVKRLILKANGKIFLQAANPKYPAIEIKENMELHIWGVVTNVIHDLLGK